MEIKIAATDDELIVSLVGSLNLACATGLAERLLAQCADHLRSRITLDLQGCTEIGTLGYGALAGFRLAPPIAGRAVRIISATAPVLEKMRTLRLDKIFEIPELVAAPQGEKG